jgi:hypothetical protein
MDFRNFVALVNQVKHFMWQCTGTSWFSFPPFAALCSLMSHKDTVLCIFQTPFLICRFLPADIHLHHSQPFLNPALWRHAVDIWTQSVHRYLSRSKMTWWHHMHWPMMSSISLLISALSFSLLLPVVAHSPSICAFLNFTLSHVALFLWGTPCYHFIIHILISHHHTSALRTVPPTPRLILSILWSLHTILSSHSTFPSVSIISPTTTCFLSIWLSTDKAPSRSYSTKCRYFPFQNLPYQHH